MTVKFAEQGALVETKGTNGVFPIRIITEGEGSTGIYRREILEKYKDVFSNKPMFMNHPKDPSKPWEREVDKIAARTDGTIEYKEVGGVAGLYTNAHVGTKWRPFMEEFGDLIDVSVYVGGDGQQDENGKIIVESFDGGDPYNSVDFVVAGGRGGKVLRAMESYRAIEDSVVEDGEDPSVKSAREKKAKEKMDKEIQEHIDATLKPVLEYVAAEKAKADKLAEKEENVPTVAEAVEAYAAADKAITEANLFQTQGESLRALAIKGEDITSALAEAIKVRDEAGNTRISEGRVTESGNSNDDFTIGAMF